MGHPPPPFGRRASISRRATLTLSLLCVGAALLACGAASAVTLTNGTASALKLNIQIYPVYPYPASRKMQIQVDIADASGYPVNLRNGQKLTCNGVGFPQGGRSLSGSSSAPDETVIQVSPQPPGGAYTFVYTDERGQQTTLVVPVGSTPLQILSPRAGDVIPIPTPKAGPIGTPAITPAAGPQSPDLGASLVVQYLLPETPPGATITSYVAAWWAIPDCAAPEKRLGYTSCKTRSELGFVSAGTVDKSGTGAALTKTVTITDGSPDSGYTFATFQPGPGWIHLDARIDWTPATTGFAAVNVQMQSATEIPITWVR